MLSLPIIAFGAVLVFASIAEKLWVLMLGLPVLTYGLLAFMVAILGCDECVAKIYGDWKHGWP
ncbi:hypothetical protein MTsPCn3_29390 [Erythrobacter sp. MTPC3]